MDGPQWVTVVDQNSQKQLRNHIATLRALKRMFGQKSHDLYGFLVSVTLIGRSMGILRR